MTVQHRFQISHEISDILNKALCIIEPELTFMDPTHQRYLHCIVYTNLLCSLGNDI